MERDEFGFSKKKPVNAARSLRRMLGSATGPVFPFQEPGTPVGASPLGLSILLGLFGLGTTGQAIFIFTQSRVPAAVGICPLLLTAMCLYGIYSAHTQAKRPRPTAATLLGGTRPPQVLAAVARFQAATDAPLRIVVRDQLDVARDARSYFERLESEGVLDPRGVLFLFSASTEGYAIGLGVELARKVPDVQGLLFHLVKFAQHKHAEGLEACLDTLASQVGLIFPARPGASRAPSDVLDIVTSEQPMPPG
jgi:hypothetical protein